MMVRAGLWLILAKANGVLAHTVDSKQSARAGHDKKPEKQMVGKK
jgi:hypothetical protein